MDGIRILEVAEHTFVPAASAILADWGAEVIKIEHVERGDAMRGLMSTGLAGLGGPVHVLLEHATAARRASGSTSRSPEGLDLLYRLAATSDVFLTNKMPGVRERLQHRRRRHPRAQPEHRLRARNGVREPRSRRRRRRLRLPRVLGTRRLRRRRDAADLDGIDRRSPGPRYGDSIGAMTIAGGIAAALLHRERTGEAHVVDVSLLGAGDVGDGRARSRSPSSAATRVGGSVPAARRRAEQPADRERTARATTGTSRSRCSRASTTGPSSAPASGAKTSSPTRASTPSRS